LTSGQTYKYDQLRQQRLTDLQTHLPNASCFNFFCPRTKYFEILCLLSNGTFVFAATAQANSSGKAKRAVSCLRFINTFYNNLILAEHK
jgi:hypothetical protein